MLTDATLPMMLPSPIRAAIRHLHAACARRRCLLTLSSPPFPALSSSSTLCSVFRHSPAAPFRYDILLPFAAVYDIIFMPFMLLFQRALL
jgi:hypothetical protein